MSESITTDPAEAHREAVAARDTRAEKAAEARRAVATAEATRSSALLAAARGDAGMKDIKLSDGRLAEAKRVAEVAEVAAILARTAAERTEIVLLRHRADTLASEVAAGQGRARAAAQDLVDALAAGRDALDRLRDAAGQMPLGQMRVAEHNRLVETTAVTNGNLARMPLSDRPTLKHSTHYIETAHVVIAVVDDRYEIEIIDPRKWIAGMPVTAGP